MTAFPGGQPALDPTRLSLGLLLAAVVAGGGLMASALTPAGAVAAFVVGAAVFGLGGAVWGSLLVVFFVSSSALSAWRSADKAEPAAHFAKGGRRDLAQVVANGGVGTVAALAHGLATAGGASTGLDTGLLAAYVGAVATVTADTWATELGLLSVKRPRLITSGEAVPPGTSGGVTVLGSAAAAGGAIVIGVSAALLMALEGWVAFRALDLSGMRFLTIAPVAGLVGAAADSWLGATVQAQYLCPTCHLETERRVHGCGTPTTRVRGWSVVTNDTVNFAASLIGAALAWGLDRLIFG